MSGRSSKGHVRSPGSSRNVVSATSTSAARCRRALHKHTTHHTKAHSAGTHSKGTHSRCTQREHGKRKRAITKACTASAYITGARNASMGDASATTQTCTALSDLRPQAGPGAKESCNRKKKTLPLRCAQCSDSSCADSLRSEEGSAEQRYHLTERFAVHTALWGRGWLREP